MKAKELRALDATARTKELNGLLREHFTLRTQIATGQANTTSNIKRIRRDIARIRTIAREMRGQEPAPAVAATKKSARGEAKKSVFKKMMQGKKKA